MKIPKELQPIVDLMAEYYEKEKMTELKGLTEEEQQTLVQGLNSRKKSQQKLEN